MEKEKEKKKKEEKSWVVVVMVMLIGGFMAILDTSIVNVAIPTMMNDFQSTMSKIQWVTTIYMLTLGVVVPTSGWLGDFWGFKRLYIYSLIAFTVGSALCSLAWSENVLIAARVVQALGGGMIMPTMMAMVYSVVPREKMGSAMGLFGLTMLVAPAIGPTLGGYLVEYVSWRWIFTVNLPIGIIGTFLAIVVLPEFPRREAGRFDLVGFLLSSAGLFCLLLALSQGQDWGWTSEKTVLILYFGIAFLGLFGYHELTTPNPLLDLTVFKYPTFLLGNLMLVVVTIGMFGGLFYIPFFLQVVRGMGALKVGLLMLPPALTSAIMLPIAGRLYDRYDPKIPVGTGILLLSYATYLFTKIDIDTSLSTIIWWNMLRALGMGMTMMPLQTALMSVLPSEQIGRGSAITNIIRQVASSFGIAVLTLILTNRVAVHSAYLRWTVSGQNLAGIAASGLADQQTIRAILQGNIAKVSFVQALNEMFYLTAFISILAFIPVFFIRKGDGGRKQGEMMAE
ncbi:MAG: DHA2 family efflux MFS transporter permease subunit [Desulfitobacteriaceae bacterium]